MPKSVADQMRMPAAPRSIEKGSSLAALLDREAIDCLVHNLALVHPKFDGASFRRAALAGLLPAVAGRRSKEGGAPAAFQVGAEATTVQPSGCGRRTRGLQPLTILQRGQHLAAVLRDHLPKRYADAVAILLRSLTPPLQRTADFGLAVFFYLPHVSFVATYGLDAEHNGGADPFEVSMHAQRELTRRFSAEFSMRPFLVRWQDRTLARLLEWTRDPDPHVRRLCSEGARPRLPWAMRIPALIKDPRPVLPILEALRDDGELYVRRSVANHLGDIAKDHPELVFDLCERWLDGASAQRRWMVRHALRHPAKKGVAAALRLRKLAK